MTAPWVVLFVALWLVVLAETLLVLGLSKRLTALESTRPGDVEASSGKMGVLPVGTRLPRIPSDRLGIPSPNVAVRCSVVLFLSPGCAPCLKLVELLRNHDLGRNVADDFELVVVSNQTGTEQFSHVGRTVVDPAGGLAKSLGVPGTPFGMAIDSEGVIRQVAIPNVVEDVKMLADARAPASMDGLTSIVT